jgi:RNA polymerase sigma-32 factor
MAEKPSQTTDDQGQEILTDEDDDSSLDEVPLPDDEPAKELPSYSLPAINADALVSTDPLTTYMAQLRHLEPKDADEQQELAEAFHEEGDVEAAKTLIMSNLRLVVKIAREYNRRRNNLMELIQEGNVGLAEAIRRYDPYRGVKFTSYAQYWIRAMILNYLMNVLQLVKVGNTRAGRKLFYNLKKARRELINEGYLQPSTKQIADHLDVSEKEVVNVSRVLDQTALSLEAPAPGYDDTPLGTIISDDQSDSPQDQVEQADVRRRIQHAVSEFRKTIDDDRELDIWDRRIVAEDPLSLQELGDAWDVSRERIRQVESVIKDRFKDFWIDTVGEDEALIFIDEE